jgi:hypothetical protein
MSEDIPIEGDEEEPPKEKQFRWSKKQVITDLCDGLGITEEDLYVAIMGAISVQFIRTGKGYVEWGQDKMLKLFAEKIRELKQKGESIDYASLAAWIKEYMEPGAEE